jgi:hypothetical protein
MKISSPSDILFDWFEDDYYELTDYRLRLRKVNDLLGAEKTLLDILQHEYNCKNLPILNKARDLARAIEFGRLPALPPTEDDPKGEPEREFTLNEKTEAVLMKIGQFTPTNAATALAVRLMKPTDQQEDALGALLQLAVVTSSPIDRTQLIALVLRLRGQVQDRKSKKWVPLADMTEEALNRLPTGLKDKINWFLLQEQAKWPQEDEEGEGGKQQEGEGILAET